MQSDRFQDLTHYWGNDRRASDKWDQTLPSDTSAFIHWPDTQHSLWENNTCDKYLVVWFKPVVFHPALCTKALWQQRQPPCAAINMWALCSQRACQSAAPRSSHAFHNTNPPTGLHLKGFFCPPCQDWCVCNFLTLDGNLVMTCSQTDGPVVCVSLVFCYGIKGLIDRIVWAEPAIGSYPNHRSSAAFPRSELVLYTLLN